MDVEEELDQGDLEHQRIAVDAEQEDFVEVASVQEDADVEVGLEDVVEVVWEEQAVFHVALVVQVQHQFI